MENIRMIPYTDSEYEFVYEVKKMHIRNMLKNVGVHG